MNRYQLESIRDSSKYFLQVPGRKRFNPRLIIHPFGGFRDSSVKLANSTTLGLKGVHVHKYLSPCQSHSGYLHYLPDGSQKPDICFTNFERYD